MKTKGRFRRLVVRGGRRYVVCGLRERPVSERASRERATSLMLPAAAFLAVLMFSAYIIGRPPASPLGFESAIPHGNVARFTIDDFVNASR
jgi:hypothetical protein